MLFLSCKKIIFHMKKTLQGKAYLLLFIMFVAVIIDSCKKDPSTDYETLQKQISETSTEAVIRAKKAFINQSVDNRVQLTGKSLLSDSLLNHRKLLWSEAYTKISGDTAYVFVPVKIPINLTIKEGDLAGTRLTDHLYLRMIDYGNGFTSSLTEMVSMIPDDASGWKITQKFSGLLLLENWYSPFSSFINVLNGKESPHSKKMMSSGGATTEGYFDCKTIGVTQCVGVEGYMVCETHTVTTCQGGGGGGGGGTGGGGSGGGPSGPGGGGGSGSSNSAINAANFNSSLLYNGLGPKPLKEYNDKCEGLKDIWNSYPDNEVYGYVTADGKFLMTNVTSFTGGDVSGVYEHDGTIYYTFPDTNGPPSGTYTGMVHSVNKYFIPVVASVHTHSPCRTDGTNGVSHDVGEADRKLAKTYPKLKNFVIGCGAIAEFNSETKFFNVRTGTLDNNCTYVK
jgi:hypothetical protein